MSRTYVSSDSTIGRVIVKYLVGAIQLSLSSIKGVVAIASVNLWELCTVPLLCGVSLVAQPIAGRYRVQIPFLAKGSHQTFKVVWSRLLTTYQNSDCSIFLAIKKRA